MSAKPLDLARFERSHAHEICVKFEFGEGPTALSYLFGRADEQYATLLNEAQALSAECKRQREQIGYLRRTLQIIAFESLDDISEKQARAALETTK